MTREIESFTSKKTRKEILDLWLTYRGSGVTVAGEVLKPIETKEYEHWYERGALIRIKDSKYGKILIQGLPAKMSESPPKLKWVCRDVGEDNTKVYLDFLGYDEKSYEISKIEV